MNITVENFETEILNSSTPVFVDFWAPWCGPCRMQTPILEDFELSDGDKAKICKVNVDDQPDIAMKYGIMSIPTIILFSGGQIVKKVVGLQSKEALLEMLSL